jgi:hypothetical protein
VGIALLGKKNKNKNRPEGKLRLNDTSQQVQPDFNLPH